MWSKTRSSFIEIAWQSDSDTDGIVHRPSRVPNETVAGWSTGTQPTQPNSNNKRKRGQLLASDEFATWFTSKSEDKFADKIIFFIILTCSIKRCITTRNTIRKTRNQSLD